MKELLKKESLFLHYLINLDDKDFKSVIKSLNKSQIRVLSGIVYNAGNGTLNLKRKDIDILKKYNSDWRKIINKQINGGIKKQLLTKRWKEIKLLLKFVVKLLPGRK